MKKLFLLSVFITTFSYAQVTDENGTAADGSGGTNLSGNIGVGVTPSSSSAYKLEVNGKTKLNNDLLLGNPYGARTEINNNLNHKIYAPTNKKTVDIDGNWYGGGYVGVYRANNGMVGANIRSNPNNSFPHQGLFVYELRDDMVSKFAIQAVSQIFSGDTEATNYISLNQPKSSIIIGDDGAYKLGQGYGLINKLKTSFENDVHLETGNLGIGTTSFVDGTDTYKLSVNGKVRAHSVKVYTTWADYVFEDEYKLLPLENVKTYINKNGHLPNIPSAKEVAENGIELGEMNSKLLEKIEELTLYLLDQEDRINKMQLEINNLKKS